MNLNLLLFLIHVFEKDSMEEIFVNQFVILSAPNIRSAITKSFSSIPALPAFRRALKHYLFFLYDLTNSMEILHIVICIG